MYIYLWIYIVIYILDCLCICVFQRALAAVHHICMHRMLKTVTTAPRPVARALLPADMIYLSILAAHAESSDSSAFGGRQQIAVQKSRYQGASAGCHAQA